MPDETTPKKGLLGLILNKGFSAVKLEWIRPLFYNLGGRKIALPGGITAAITTIATAAGDAFGWPHAVVCSSLALMGAVATFSIAYEDANKMVEEPDDEAAEE